MKKINIFFFMCIMFFIMHTPLAKGQQPCTGIFSICDTECRSTPPGACNTGHTTDDNVEWPCDIHINGSCEDADFNATPEYLQEFGWADEEDASPEIIDSICYQTSTSYYDQVFNSTGQKRIERTWNIILWTTGEVWTYKQNIYISLQSIQICDTLAWNTPFGDCASGHTSSDNVEWPANITVHSPFITPEDLLSNPDVNDHDAQPEIITNCGLIEKAYSDFVTPINDSTLIVERTWTIYDFQALMEWPHKQIITIIADLTVRHVCVVRENGDPIPGVVLAAGAETGTDGCFTFDDPDGITVTPVKDSPLQEGVNLLDKILILEHILGITELSPFQQRAADLNQSAGISAVDVVEMNKLIEGTLVPAFSHDWKFFDVNVNPIGSVDISNPFTAYKFIGVKMGDLDNSFPLSVTAPLGHIALQANDEILNKKEDYTIDYHLEKNSRFVGFTVQIENVNANVDVLDILAPNLPGFSFEDNVTITPTQITIQWISESFLNTGIIFPSDLPLFSIHFRAKENSILSEELQLQTSYENILKPFGNDAALRIGMNYENVIVSSVLPLADGQSIDFYPNPANDKIHFKNLPTGPDEFVSIVDATGKIRLKSTLTSTLDISELPSGLFYISITTEHKPGRAVPLSIIR